MTLLIFPANIYNIRIYQPRCTPLFMIFKDEVSYTDMYILLLPIIILII